jgi:hypothetical protein
MSLNIFSKAGITNVNRTKSTATAMTNTPRGYTMALRTCLLSFTRFSM